MVRVNLNILQRKIGEFLLLEIQYRTVNCVISPPTSLSFWTMNTATRMILDMDESWTWCGMVTCQKRIRSYLIPELLERTTWYYRLHSVRMHAMRVRLTGNVLPYQLETLKGISWTHVHHFIVWRYHQNIQLWLKQKFEVPRANRKTQQLTMFSATRSSPPVATTM